VIREQVHARPRHQNREPLDQFQGLRTMAVVPSRQVLAIVEPLVTRQLQRLGASCRKGQRLAGASDKHPVEDQRMEMHHAAQPVVPGQLISQATMAASLTKCTSRWMTRL
jgi:hypothetical protein